MKRTQRAQRATQTRTKAPRGNLPLFTAKRRRRAHSGQYDDMTKIDIELAKVLLKLIEESGDTLQGETATRIYSLISSILAKYGYKLPPLPRA